MLLLIPRCAPIPCSTAHLSSTHQHDHSKFVPAVGLYAVAALLYIQMTDSFLAVSGGGFCRGGTISYKFDGARACHHAHLLWGWRTPAALLAMARINGAAPTHQLRGACDCTLQSSDLPSCWARPAPPGLAWPGPRSCQIANSCCFQTNISV